MKKFYTYLSRHMAFRKAEESLAVQNNLRQYLQTGIITLKTGTASESSLGE
jgi:hypothetical protein